MMMPPEVPSEYIYLGSALYPNQFDSTPNNTCHAYYKIVDGKIEHYQYLYSGSQLLSIENGHYMSGFKEWFFDTFKKKTRNEDLI